MVNRRGWTREQCRRGGLVTAEKRRKAAKRKADEEEAHQARIEDDEWERKVQTNEHDYPVD